MTPTELSVGKQLEVSSSRLSMLTGTDALAMRADRNRVIAYICVESSPFVAVTESMIIYVNVDNARVPIGSLSIYQREWTGRITELGSLVTMPIRILSGAANTAAMGVHEIKLIRPPSEDEA